MLGQGIITKDYFADLTPTHLQDSGAARTRTRHCSPLLNGVHNMTEKGLSEMLKVSRHTLLQYRNKGLIPFTYCQGKVLYLSGAECTKNFERNYQPSRKQNRVIESINHSILFNVIIFCMEKT